MKSFMASFVICYGNLAIVVSQSIMYSPYIEQSIAIVFYFFLAMLSLCQNK